MSLCLIKYIDENTLLIGADSRACTYSDDNNKYVTSDNVKKLIPISDKSIAFVSGTARPLLNTLKKFKEVENRNMPTLAQILKSALEEEPENIKDKLHAILYFTIEEGKVGYWLISNACKFVPIYIPYSDNAKQAIIGAYTDSIAKDYYSQLNNSNSKSEYLDIFKDIFQKSNSYEVGGTADIFELTPTEIKHIDTFKIIDKQEYQRIPKTDFEIYNLKGLNINDHFKIDDNGYVTINGGSISFSAVDGLQDKLDTLEDSIPTLPSYIKSTYIGATEIRSPTIKAGEFYGAEYYDTNEVAKLTLNCGNFSDLVYSNTGKGTSSNGYEIFKIRDSASGYVEMSLAGVPFATANMINNTITLSDNVKVVARFGG